MKAVRGSNRAATKAPTKQTQEKSKKPTGKRAAKGQVKYLRAVQCQKTHFRWSGGALTLFHVQHSDLGEVGRKTQQKPAKKGTGEFFSTGCLYGCVHFTVPFPEWRHVVGPRGQKNWQTISRSSIIEVESIMDLAIL